MSALFQKLVERWDAEKLSNLDLALMRSDKDRTSITLTLMSIMEAMHGVAHALGVEVPHDAWESCERNPCAPVANNLRLITLRFMPHGGLYVEHNAETKSYQVLRPEVIDEAAVFTVLKNFPLDDYKTRQDAFDAAFAAADRMATNRT